MTYPTIDSFQSNGIENITPTNMLDVLGSCILQIYEQKGEKVYETKDHKSTIPGMGKKILIVILYQGQM